MRYARIQTGGRTSWWRGVEREYRFTVPVSALTVCKNMKTERWGVDGGQAGAKHDIVWFPDSDKELHEGIHRDEFETREKILIKIGGGGCYGPPTARSHKGFKNEYVSREAACEEYGVVITDFADHSGR